MIYGSTFFSLGLMNRILESGFVFLDVPVSEIGTQTAVLYLISIISFPAAWFGAKFALGTITGYRSKSVGELMKFE